ncbi:MAG: sigma-70 family RNA polymerase sigma factor [Ketobacteraceae bacterium]|nr:sigma-70 family RNA polymerase sigma factor [Ketobacteraceae bacterium]
MYQWHFLEEHPGDEPDQGTETGLPTGSLYFDSDWADVPWDLSVDTPLPEAGNQSLFEPDPGEDSGGPDNELLFQGAHEASHELLTREQEIGIAEQLQQRFGELQSQLVRDRQLLDRVCEQICDEEYHNDPAGFDGITTLYDTLLVYQQLAQTNARFEVEYFQVWQRLREQLREAALNRDFVILLADDVIRSGGSRQPEWRAEIRECQQALFAARNRFVSANIRLVYHVARRHLDKGMSLEDMVQEGILGLMRAALKFDAAVGVRFSTYSFWWIKQAIRQAIARQRSLIRYPTHINDQVNRIYGYVQDELRRTGKKPAPAQIVKATGFSRKKVRDLLELTNFCVSASVALYDDGDRTLMDELSYEATDWTPETGAAESESRNRLADMLAILSRREAMIVAMKYGIGHRRPYSLNEIAPQVGVSRERVRQIIEESLDKLREQFAGGDLPAVIELE